MSHSSKPNALVSEVSSASLESSTSSSGKAQSTKPKTIVSGVSSASLESSSSDKTSKSNDKHAEEVIIKPVREEAVAAGIRQRILMLQKMAMKADELEKKSWDTFKAQDLKSLMLVSGREMEAEIELDPATQAMKRNRERRKSRSRSRSPKKTVVAAPVEGEQKEPISQPETDAIVEEESEDDGEDGDEDYSDESSDEENGPIVEEKKPEEPVEEKKPEEPVEEKKPEVPVEEEKPEEPAEEKKPEVPVEEKKPEEIIDEKKPEEKPAETVTESKPEPVVEETKPVEVVPEAKVEEPKEQKSYVLSEDAKKALEYKTTLGEEHARAVREALNRSAPISKEAEELAQQARVMLEEISGLLDREAPQLGEDETSELRSQLAKVKAILDARAEFAKIHRERTRDVEQKLEGLSDKISEGRKEIEQIEAEYEAELAKLAAPSSPPPVMKYKKPEETIPLPKDVKAKLEPTPPSAEHVYNRKVYLIFSIPVQVPQGSLVRYTLDGSEPKPGNASSYVAPLTVKAARLKTTATVKWVVEDGKGGRFGPVEERVYKVERPWYKKVRKEENGPGAGQIGAAQRKAALQSVLVQG